MGAQQTIGNYNSDYITEIRQTVSMILSGGNLSDRQFLDLEIADRAAALVIGIERDWDSIGRRVEKLDYSVNRAIEDGEGYGY